MEEKDHTKIIQQKPEKWNNIFKEVSEKSLNLEFHDLKSS